MFVGRKYENSELTSCLHDVLKGKGKVIFITGEAGMGKTALVEHWWKNVSENFNKNVEFEDPVFAKASCSIPVGGLNVGEMEALQPFADLLSSLYRESAKDEKKFKKISSVMLEAAPDWLNVLPIIGKIAAAGVKTYNIYKKNKTTEDKQKNKAVNQQQVFQQYVNFLLALTENGNSVVIWIDDLHWADTSSLNLLFYLARQIGDKPVLIIVTYRPEEVFSDSGTLLKVKNEIVRYELGETINLNYFTEPEVVSLLSKSYGSYRQNTRFEAWLLKISGGNPLFITNYLKTLYEDKLINDNGEIAGGYSGLKPPETVKAVIEERIRRIEEDVNDMLRYATAEGEEFTSYIINKLTGKAPLEILKILKKGEAQGIINNKGSFEVYSSEKTTLYNFIHSLFYNALYESLNDEEKNILHRQCYEVLKSVWENNKDNILLATKLLAHAEKCGEYYSASEIGYSTAMKLWQKFAKDEALEIMNRITEKYSKEIKARDISLYEKEFLPKILSEVKYSCAEILSRTGNFNQAIDTYKEAEELYEKCGNIAGKIWALNGIAFVLIRFNRLKESIEYSTKALELAEKINLTRGKLVSLNHIADATWALGDTDKAIEILKNCVSVNEQTEDELTLCFFYYAIGSLYAYKHSLNEAEHYTNLSLEISRKLKAEKYEANALGISALIMAEKGSFKEALEILERVLEVQVSTSDRHAEAWTLNKIGQIQRDLNMYEKAISSIKRSYEIFDEIDNKGEAAKSLMYLGNIFRLVERYEESLGSLEQSLDIASSLENSLLKALIIGEIAYTKEKTGNIDEAIGSLTEAVSILKNLKYEGVSEYETELERMKKIKKN